MDLGNEHKSRFRVTRPTVWANMKQQDLDPRLRRRVLRHALWTGATLPGWSAGKVSNFHLSREEGSSRSRRIPTAVSATILVVLRKLRALCSDREADIVRVASHLDSLQSGLRMQVPACAIAAAYCKTAYLYGVKPLDRMTDPKGRVDIDIGEVDIPEFVLRSCWVPQSIQANRILAEFEVLGLFASSSSRWHHQNEWLMSLGVIAQRKRRFAPRGVSTRIGSAFRFALVPLGVSQIG
ncbi:hypothetical protein ACEQUB_01622 [Ralstonia syzygii]